MLADADLIFPFDTARPQFPLRAVEYFLKYVTDQLFIESIIGLTGRRLVSVKYNGMVGCEVDLIREDDGLFDRRHLSEIIVSRQHLDQGAFAAFRKKCISYLGKQQGSDEQQGSDAAAEQNDHHALVATRTQEIANLERIASERKESLDYHTRALAACTEEIADRERKAEENQRKAVAEYQKQLDDLARTLAARTQEIAALERKAENQQKAVAKHQKKIDDLVSIAAKHEQKVDDIKATQQNHTRKGNQATEVVEIMRWHQSHVRRFEDITLECKYKNGKTEWLHPHQLLRPHKCMRRWFRERQAETKDNGMVDRDKNARLRLVELCRKDSSGQFESLLDNGF